MPEVCHVIAQLDASNGGTALALRGLALSQHRQGLGCRVLHTFLDGDSLDVSRELEGAGITVHRIGPCRGRTLKWHAGIAPTCRAAFAGVSAIHLHGIWEHVHWVALRIAESLGIPTVLRPCGMLDSWSLGRAGLGKKLHLAIRGRRMIQRAAAVHCTTEAERDNSPLISQLARSVIVEPNGVDLEGMLVAGDVSRDPAEILFLGRIHPKKCCELLIDAMSQPALRSHRLRFVGPGDAGYVESLKARSRDRGLDGRVRFAGALFGAEKFEALYRAACFVLPSHQENFGNAVLEALACGTPVVVSTGVALASVVEQEGLGTVCELSEESIAAGITKALALGSPDYQNRASSFVKTNYHWDVIARRWDQHYARLAAQAAEARSGRAA